MGKPSLESAAIDEQRLWLDSLSRPPFLNSTRVRSEIVAAIKSLYQLHRLKEPIIVFCDSPWQVIVAPMVLDAVWMGRNSQHLLNENPSNQVEELWNKLVHSLLQLDLSFVRLNGVPNPVCGDLLRDQFQLWVPKAITSWRRSDLPASEKKTLIDLLQTQIWAHPNMNALVQLREASRRAIRAHEPELERLINRGALAGEHLSRIRTPRPIISYYHANARWLPLERVALATFSETHKFCKYPAEIRQHINPWKQLSLLATQCSFYSRACFVSERPDLVKVDENVRLHNDSGPAVRYKDGFEIYCWHGTDVPASVIMEPQSITSTHIEQELNVNVRRVLIAIYGEDRFLMERGFLVSRDEYGELYMRPQAGDEPLVMARVRNSTPEPDGTYTHYFLRVPPEVTTPRQAIAWTFGLSSLEYKPDIET